ncbi:uncharacterized protein LY79DRAFT_337844 [Colletotrichum navitas]|uniref:Uncharacterized protein n=1 Tax=Colletotrichum navitas TaxID=681940 RepID=A0AAD8PT57_9PEZI|nr:uncharacterized protein LY79DRAFT_337844 [Colletotrichum navitas]KAK1579568.1 hypothetical protein LY79DRAFT_337844 [Colletotrichum navitas]
MLDHSSTLPPPPPPPVITMLPPKTKFVREIERGRCHCDTPSPPGATYLHRVLRRWRYGDDADSILPVHEKRRRPLRHAIYTRRPGARLAAARGSGSAASARVVEEYRRDNAAARRRRRRLTFLALMLAATVLILGAAILGFVLVSAQKT